MFTSTGTKAYSVYHLLALNTVIILFNHELKLILDYEMTYLACLPLCKTDKCLLGLYDSDQNENQNISFQD